MDRYKDLTHFSRENTLNNFSYWFPKVKDCGIEVPKSVVIQIPDELWKGDTFYLEDLPRNNVEIEKFVREQVIPAIEQSTLSSPILFVKNGAFSNKFDAAANCFSRNDVYDLVASIRNIQYESLCFETGGENEIVIRERIPANGMLIPTIYNGLPLRPEIRVFYDFDIREPIFAVDYWDYDYVYPHIMSATDRIVFERMKDYLARTFALVKDSVIELVSNSMKNVNGLEGPWSIDLMLSDYPSEVRRDLVADLQPKYYTVPLFEPTVYLIDMAVAERSAYWDRRPGKES